MKKQLFLSIITVIGCLLILLMSACVHAPNRDSDDNDSDDDNHYSYTFEYTLLEKALAEALGKVPGEEITPDELATLTHLTVPPPLDGAYGVWIDISLLAHCINLKALNLTGYAVDLSPLAGLPRLERLNLSGGGILDFQLLTGLVNLQQLDLSWNRLNNLANLEPLAELVNLQTLDLSSNRLSDLTVLAGMIQLKMLSLRDNQIRDITPLTNLIKIDKLYLDDNMIVDLKPLVDNPGLVDDTREDFDWAGDTVTVSGNPLSDISRKVYIPALQARGVNVRH